MATQKPDNVLLHCPSGARWRSKRPITPALDLNGGPITCRWAPVVLIKSVVRLILQWAGCGRYMGSHSMSGLGKASPLPVSAELIASTCRMRSAGVPPRPGA